MFDKLRFQWRVRRKQTPLLRRMERGWCIGYAAESYNRRANIVLVRESKAGYVIGYRKWSREEWLAEEAKPQEF